MTERDKKLIKDYGPRFVARSRMIKDQLLHLQADVVSCATDYESQVLTKSMAEFIDRLNEIEKMVISRVETSIGEDEFLTLYDKAREDIKRFTM